MNRTALRLATVAALLNGGAAPFPTLARDAVYDSRSDPIDDIADKDRLPCIIVHTDEDRTGGARKLLAGARTLMLRIQIGVVTTAIDPETGDRYAGWPETDAALEAFVDLLEFQVQSALFGGSPWALWWQGLFSPSALSSMPAYTAPEMGRVRLAAREITITLTPFPQDCLTTGVKSADTPDPVPGLPPQLLSVFSYIDARGAGDIKTAAAQLLASLEAQSLPSDTAYEMLRKVQVAIPEQAAPEGEQPKTDIAFTALDQEE